MRNRIRQAFIAARAALQGTDALQWPNDDRGREQFKVAEWNPHRAFQQNADVLVVTTAVSRELLRDSVDAESIAGLVAEEARSAAYKATLERIRNGEG